MPALRKYPPELRERAQRPVAEAREAEPGLWLNAAVLRFGPRVGVKPDTLHGWVEQAGIDGVGGLGTTTTEAGSAEGAGVGDPPSVSATSGWPA